jgi:hypothetical protein
VLSRDGLVLRVAPLAGSGPEPDNLPTEAMQ